ncbi:hypothetical protein [Polyangium fumosum]|uniref:Uncharacterized protein n=1 Tax=Polyangium fumosum TaxID=889272 RepID=A0A4U1JJZ8_9BACT|nr:hypothetical protein [Polyangium fumosum]TKD13079.1 hypothetical protein E8A74_00540 [Polyangium fumosum]
MAAHRLDFEADRWPPACNQEEDFSAALSSWVPPMGIDAGAERVLEVRIKRLPDGGKAATVRVKGAAGEVTGEKATAYPPATECHKVLFWAAFDAAMLMGWNVRWEPEPPPPCPPCPPAPAQPPPQACPLPLPPPRPLPPPQPKRFFAGLGIGAFWNVAPEPFFAPRVTAGWNVSPRFALELDFAAWPLMTANPQNGPTAVDVDAYFGTAAGCYRFGRFLGCGLVAGGVLLGSGTNRAYRQEYTTPLLGMGARVEAEVPLGDWLVWRSGVDALGFPVPRRFINYPDVLWQPFPLAMSVTTSVVWEF